MSNITIQFVNYLYDDIYIFLSQYNSLTTAPLTYQGQYLSVTKNGNASTTILLDTSFNLVQCVYKYNNKDTIYYSMFNIVNIFDITDCVDGTTYNVYLNQYNENNKYSDIIKLSTTITNVFTLSQNFINNFVLDPMKEPINLQDNKKDLSNLCNSFYVKLGGNNIDSDGNTTVYYICCNNKDLNTYLENQVPIPTPKNNKFWIVLLIFGIVIIIAIIAIIISVLLHHTKDNDEKLENA